MKKLNKKFILPVIAGALTIGSLTSPVLADPSAADNDYQIVVVEKNPETGKYVKKISWVEHEYYGTTGFCNICGMTINEGNHTNKITNNKGGVVLPKDDENGIPEITENTITLKMNGNLINVDCKSGTYKEIFDYIKKQGYTDFTVKNFWNTQVYSWYKFDNKKICEVFINNKDGIVKPKDEENGIPVISENTITLKMSGNLINIDCKSGTYKEVFNYIKKQGYTDFTVKNYWNTQVYSWYKFDNKKICEVFFK